MESIIVLFVIFYILFMFKRHFQQADGYIAVHYCLRFTTGLVPFVAEGYIAFPYCLRFTRGLIPFVAEGYIAFHYCIRFTRGLVPFVER
jgi:prolipoprotein diacylglyceryltransferase